jgi:hypothetical protein
MFSDSNRRKNVQLSYLRWRAVALITHLAAVSAGSVGAHLGVGQHRATARVLKYSCDTHTRFINSVNHRLKILKKKHFGSVMKSLRIAMIQNKILINLKYFLNLFFVHEKSGSPILQRIIITDIILIYLHWPKNWYWYVQKNHSLVL